MDRMDVNHNGNVEGDEFMAALIDWWGPSRRRRPAAKPLANAPRRRGPRGVWAAVTGGLRRFSAGATSRLLCTAPNQGKILH